MRRPSKLKLLLQIPKDEYEDHLLDRKDYHMSLLEDTVIEQSEIIIEQRAEIQKNFPLALFTKLLYFLESIKDTIRSVSFSLSEERQTEWYQKILQVIEPSYGFLALTLFSLILR